MILALERRIAARSAKDSKSRPVHSVPQQKLARAVLGECRAIYWPFVTREIARFRFSFRVMTVEPYHCRDSSAGLPLRGVIHCSTEHKCGWQFAVTQPVYDVVTFIARKRPVPKPRGTVPVRTSSHSGQLPPQEQTAHPVTPGQPAALGELLLEFF